MPFSNAFVYPFSPVVLMPSTKYFWQNRNSKKIGSKDSTDMANIAPQFVSEVGSLYIRSAMETGYSAGLFK